MRIRLSKPKGKAVLTCIREDGSLTYTRPRHGAFFARHDLMHFVVETTLGLSHSFFGLIAGGRSIESFSRPGAAHELPDEALLTEFIVGQLDQEFVFGTPSSAEDFNRTLIASVARAAQRAASPPRRISAEALAEIRTQFAGLRARYEALGPDEHLELEFPEKKKAHGL